FREPNDSLGRSTGDQALQAAAALLREVLDDVGTIARVGGDEFAAIIENLDNAQQAIERAERIIQALSTPLPLHGHDIFVTASVGVSLQSPHVDDVDMLLQTAETAMYRAKDAGRNGIVLYAPEMNTHTVKLQNIATLLRLALDRG